MNVAARTKPGPPPSSGPEPGEIAVATTRIVAPVRNTKGIDCVVALPTRRGERSVAGINGAGFGFAMEHL